METRQEEEKPRAAEEPSAVQTELEGSEARLRRLVEGTRAIPWEADARTWLFTYVGPQAVKLLGYPIERWYEKDFWTSHIHPDDRERTVQFCVDMSQSFEHYEFEYRMIAADGRAVWLQDIVGVAMKDGVPEKLYGFMIDISERQQVERVLRELSGRLINAQEEERRRIARELHDDLSQKVALLSVELQQLGQTPPGSGAKILARTHDLWERTRELSSDVHRLSHRLHPSKLEQLGLVTSVASLCREMSEQHGIEVECVSDEAPRSIPGDIALCLFRIVQESLSNVIKHSGTKAARVELAGRKSAIQVRISDAGVGFDTESVRAKTGLGLLGMRERLRPLDGEMSIDSQPGQGTRIEVRVPLPPSEPPARGFP